MEKVNGKVLVLGDDDRSFLTVVRSLGRKNISVHVGWCPPSSFALHSKYIKKVHDIPPFSFQNNSWKESLISLFQQEKFYRNHILSRVSFTKTLTDNNE